MKKAHQIVAPYDPGAISGNGSEHCSKVLSSGFLPDLTQIGIQLKELSDTEA